jgi:hypothetical protein
MARSGSGYAGGLVQLAMVLARFPQFSVVWAGFPAVAALNPLPGLTLQPIWRCLFAGGRNIL